MYTKTIIYGGCEFSTTLLNIFFPLMLKQEFESLIDCAYFHTRSDGKLFTISRMNATACGRQSTDRSLWEAHDAHPEQTLNGLSGIRLTIDLKKIKVRGQIAEDHSITASNYKLKITHVFFYLGATIADDLSQDPEDQQTKQTVLATSTFSRIPKRVWEKRKLNIIICPRVGLYARSRRNTQFSNFSERRGFITFF